MSSISVMSALGRKPTSALHKGMSALPPKSGHVRCNSRCPLWAMSRLMHRGKNFRLFDHLVGFRGLGRPCFCRSAGEPTSLCKRTRARLGKSASLPTRGCHSILGYQPATSDRSGRAAKQLTIINAEVPMLSREAIPSIPTVLCPMCGVRMRFATCEPTEDGHDRMTFDCGCGFKYQVSENIARALARNNADMRPRFSPNEKKGCAFGATNS